MRAAKRKGTPVRSCPSFCGAVREFSRENVRAENAPYRPGASDGLRTFSGQAALAGDQREKTETAEEHRVSRGLGNVGDIAQRHGPRPRRNNPRARLGR